MEITALGLYLAAAFVGGAVSGISGFAMGIVLSGIWLHIISPRQTAILIVGYGLLTQGYAIWKLRHALSWRNITPFVVGGAVGVPLGAILLGVINPVHLRIGLGVFLVLYSAYSLARPSFRPLHPPMAADVGVGFLNGLLGGLSGLTGIVVIVWCQFRDWKRDVQRAVFQPVNLATIILSAVSFAIAGEVTPEVIHLYLLGLPTILAGLWVGFKLYGIVDEAVFRKLVLALLLISGAALLFPLVAGLVPIKL